MNTKDELDLKREEAERLLRQANLLQMRGQLAEARETCQKAIEVAPDLATAWELLGDLLKAEGSNKEACEAYKQAHELDPTLVVAERKYAELVLQLGEEQYQHQQWEQMIAHPESQTMLPKRNPGLALLLSMCLPGFGQLYNGEFVKGGVIIGLTILGWLILLAMPNSNQFMENFFYMLFAMNRVQPVYLSAFSLGLMVALVCVYLYAVVDAPLRAAQYNKRLEQS